MIKHDTVPDGCRLCKKLIEAPHECDDKNCKGWKNFRKLELLNKIIDTACKSPFMQIDMELYVKQFEAIERGE